MLGGLCYIRDEEVFVRTELWGERGSLGVSGLWKGIPVNIVIIYAPCSFEGKKELWEMLET